MGGRLTERVTVHLEGRTLGFDVPAGAEPAAVYAEILRLNERVAWGWACREYDIDGVRHPVIRKLLIARSYVEMWGRVILRATILRQRTKRQISELRAALEEAEHGE